MSLAFANASTSRRNRLPIFSITAGDEIGIPRCSRQNRSTWAPTCNLGTYAFRYNRSTHTTSRPTWPSNTSLMLVTVAMHEACANHTPAATPLGGGRGEGLPSPR